MTRNSVVWCLFCLSKYKKGEIRVAISFQVTMIIVVLLTVIGVVGEKEDKELRQLLCTICIISIMLFFGSVIL